MTYTDKYGTFFGRLTLAKNVAVFHSDTGEIATRLDTGVYPIGSNLSARYEHPEGIVLTANDALAIGIEIEK